jgi:hypothetical protein
MPSYAFRCRGCGATDTLVSPMYEIEGTELTCETPDCPVGWMTRDYRAENVGLNGMVEMKRVREEGGNSAVRDLFLPTAKDFESPEDPDGSRGVRAWNDEHEPAPTNKKPWRPVSPRKSF